MSPKRQGTSTELMPSIMGAFDTLISQPSKPPRRTHQSSNFTNLSPSVMKILSNVSVEPEISRNFASDESLALKRAIHRRSMRLTPEKNRSNEKLDDIISPNVQKMISNFPDTELVISGNGGNKVLRNGSFLYHSNLDFNNSAVSKCCSGNGNELKNVRSECEEERDESEGGRVVKSGTENGFQAPLGSYLHTAHGIASRTPVGRKNLGKFLQVPSENTNSTTSSEVSRPVSMTSIGSSCSSSGSSCPHQPSSAYLASAESLDSDPEPTGSQGSADSGIAEQIIMSPESRVLQEVLDTETVYVADLNEVIQGYLVPWQCDPTSPLTDHLPSLFSNLEEIHKFNKTFLDQLRDADFNPTRIANVFIQNNAGFTVYNEYCTHYPKTMEVLGELTAKENMTPLFRERQLALRHALPLGSYLLKPVQRILKYHLLLQRLSKQCDPAHKPAVDLALTTMTSVASNINNMKRKHEHAVRVHEIQSQLYGWNGPDLTTLGELIAEGSFRVNGAKGRRFVFLFDKMLLMAKSKQDGALAYKSHIMCSNLMLVEQVRGEPLSFQILPFDNPRLQCTLRARSPQHKREWTLQIKRVILENYSAVIPNHARQLVMQLGQEVNETEDSGDKWSPLNKNTTPHYLERRSRVRKSRDSSSMRSTSQDRTFPSLTSWRRKSEPSMTQIPQYNTKTLPKKITKLKKAKETTTGDGSSAKFYTDLSDSENCDESCESLTVNNSIDEEIEVGEEAREEEVTHAEKNIEKIVSDLLMEQEEFKKIMKRPRRNARGSEPCAASWYEAEARKLPSKADSLPRSFQLSDRTDNEAILPEKHKLDESLKENPDDEQHEIDLASQLDDHDYPVHKIYRKSAIRTSLVQRIRALMSEDDRSSKYPLRKQGSKLMGEKIAHPDYVDPQKFFTNSSVELSECENLVEPERLDMTISGKEVLKEVDKRLNSSNLLPDELRNSSSSKTSAKVSNSMFSENLSSHKREEIKSSIISSQSNSDNCYYERVLDETLVEEYTKDASGRLVVKQDSFKSMENTFYSSRYSSSNESNQKSAVIKRPNNAPPPIPTKPKGLALINPKIAPKPSELHQNGEKSWVKAMVGRFE